MNPERIEGERDNIDYGMKKKITAHFGDDWIRIKTTDNKKKPYSIEIHKNKELSAEYDVPPRFWTSPYWTRKISKKLGNEEEDVEKELSSRSESLELLLTRIIEEKKIPYEETLTPSDIEAANDLLKNPEFLRIVLEANKNEIVGEEETRLLLYLISVTAKMKQKINAQITGDSAAGKTAITNAILKLFPEDNVNYYSRITGTALDHAERDWNGKILFVGEGAGISAAIETIKMFTDDSGRGTRLLVTEKDEHGQMQAKEKTSSGMPVFITTTAKIIDDPEFNNRLITIPVNLTKEQTKKITEFQAEKNLKPWEYEEETELLNDLKNAFFFLKPMPVIVPYAKALLPRFKHNQIRTRRDFQKLIWIIKASAFLFQKQRKTIKKYGTEYILADLQDLFNAELIASKAMERTTEGLHETTAGVLKEVFKHEDDLRVREVEDSGVEGTMGFTVNDFMRITKPNLMRKTVSDHLSDLSEHGLIYKKKKGKENIFWVLEEEEVSTTSAGNNAYSDCMKEVTTYLKHQFSQKNCTKDTLHSFIKENLYNPISSIYSPIDFSPHDGMVKLGKVGMPVEEMGVVEEAAADDAT